MYCISLDVVLCLFRCIAQCIAQCLCDVISRYKLWCKHWRLRQQHMSERSYVCRWCQQLHMCLYWWLDGRQVFTGKLWHLYRWLDGNICTQVNHDTCTGDWMDNSCSEVNWHLTDGWMGERCSQVSYDSHTGDWMWDKCPQVNRHLYRWFDGINPLVGKFFLQPSNWHEDNFWHTFTWSFFHVYCLAQTFFFGTHISRAENWSFTPIYSAG